MIFLKILSRLPLTILYALSNLIYFTAFRILHYRKKVVLDNLKNAFPEKNEQEIRLITMRFYKRLADYIIETLKAITISKKELNSRVNLKNADTFNTFRDNHQSILVLADHQFNWEWGFLACSLQLPLPVVAIYQKLSNQSFDKLIVKTRSKFGGKAIEKDRAIRELIRTKSQLKAIGLVADQSPSKQAPKYWAEFLNQDTAFFQGPQQLAKVTGYPVYFMHVIPVKRGYYEVELLPIIDPPYSDNGFEVIDRYIDKIEALIKEDPPSWLWSHRRWKHVKNNNENGVNESENQTAG